MPVEASRVETTVRAPADAVWAALTTASALKQLFFGADVETDWRVGSPIRFRGEWKGKRYEDKGTVQTVDPGKRLRFTHWSPLSGVPDAPEHYHVVSFELSPAGDGTRVVLTQTNQDDAELLTDASRSELAKNWSALRATLKRLVERPLGRLTGAEGDPRTGARLDSAAADPHHWLAPLPTGRPTPAAVVAYEAPTTAETRMLLTAVAF